MTNILKILYNKHNIGVGWGHVIGSLKMGFEIKFEITIFEITVFDVKPSSLWIDVNNDRRRFNKAGSLNKES
jgi:hypothetical protein